MPSAMEDLWTSFKTIKDEKPTAVSYGKLMNGNKTKKKINSNENVAIMLNIQMKMLRSCLMIVIVNYLDMLFITTWFRRFSL